MCRSQLVVQISMWWSRQPPLVEKSAVCWTRRVREWITNQPCLGRATPESWMVAALGPSLPSQSELAVMTKQGRVGNLADCAFKCLCRMQNSPEYKVCYFFSIFSVCIKLQRSLTTWGRCREEREGRQQKKERDMKSSRWSATQHNSMTHSDNMRSCISLMGMPSLDGAVGERRGVGWGQQYIPEYMTRCSRSDRSQLWPMKPEHFHRCFYTLGSTSSHRPNSTPTLFLVQLALVSAYRAFTCCTVNVEHCVSYHTCSKWRPDAENSAF